MEMHLKNLQGRCTRGMTSTNCGIHATKALSSSVVFLINCSMYVYSYSFVPNFNKGATVSVNTAINLTI